jgi:serine phosphatase RsbU (regulator of sigma subunit)
MGVEENLRLSATLEKLNRVVNHSALASKFISLFYAELESAGRRLLQRGHNPPLLWDGAASASSRGRDDPGPNPDSQYERGYETLVPGRSSSPIRTASSRPVNASDEAFGMERLQR